MEGVVKGREHFQEESFQQLLQVLRFDVKQDQMQIKMLSLLQEKCHQYLNSASSFFTAYEVLKSLLMSAKSQSVLLMQNVIATLTCLLIEVVHLLDNPSDALNDLIRLFAQVLSKGDESIVCLEATILMSLEEIEYHCPDLLEECNLNDIFQRFKSFSYHQSASWSLLALHYLEQGSMARKFSDSSRSISDQNSFAILGDLQDGSFDPKEVGKVLASFLESVCTMTIPCSVRIVEKVSNCLQKYAVSPKILSCFFFNGLKSFDVLTFQMALKLLNTFFNEVGENATDVAYSAILVLASHPCLSTVEKLLAFNWINFLQAKMTQSDLNLSAYYPVVFDSVDLTIKKLDCLSWQCLASNKKGSDTSMMLLKGSTRLQKLVHHGVGGEVAAAFYGIMFCFYARHKNRHTSEEISKLLLAVATVHVKFIPNTIDFVSAVWKHLSDKRTMPQDIIASMLKMMGSCNMSDLFENLDYYLQVLHFATELKDSDLKYIVSLLLSILQNTAVCSIGNWMKGNKILLICQGLMKQEAFQSITRLQEVLLLIGKQYADSDISDRAKFYYLLLCTLSRNKLLRVLCADSVIDSSSLSQIVQAEITSTCAPLSEPIQMLAMPIFELRRKNRMFSYDYKGVSDVCETVSHYISIVNQIKLSVNLICQVVCLKTLDSISSEVYAVTLAFFSKMTNLAVPDIFVPKMHIVEGERSCNVKVQLVCKLPIPERLLIRATLGMITGHVLASDIHPLELSFTDFFIKPEVLKSFTNIKPQKIAEHFLSSQHAADSIFPQAYSVFQLPLSWESLKKMLYSSLKDYIVADNNNCLQMLILLPEHYHLAVQFETFDRLVTVTMGTDNWIILDQGAKWLLSLT